jgi:hypothetical protein
MAKKPDNEAKHPLQITAPFRFLAFIFMETIKHTFRKGPRVTLPLLSNNNNKKYNWQIINPR